MAARGDPWDIPEWHFIRQEAMLVRHLVGAGATAIGQANYANKKGEYYRAFFELSVGMERLAKLILVVDYALTHAGKLPDEKLVRQFGHDLKSLFTAVDQVITARALNLRYPRPSDAVATAIIENLDAFADAKRGRYANFTALGNPKNDQHEPVSKWWSEVSEEILRQKYVGKRIEQHKAKQAAATLPMLGKAIVVGVHTETRSLIPDFQTAVMLSGQAELVQKWARYHVLTIVRWLAETYAELADVAAYKHGFDAFWESWDFFSCFRAPDSDLKKYKVWPER